MLRSMLAWVLAGFGTAAAAQEVSVIGKTEGSVITVWKDLEAAKTGAKLATSGVENPDAYRPFVACLVEPGTKVVVTKGLGAASEIVVSSGDSAGCKGVLPNFQLPRQ